MNGDDPSKLTLETIKLKLDSHSSLSIVGSDGEHWNAYFDFLPPASSQEIEHIRSHWLLLDSYQKFLARCNGAILFKEPTYGQWGFQLYSTKELVEKNELWHRLYRDIPSTYCVFAESLGDCDLLLIDTNSSSAITGERNIIDGDVGYNVKQWLIIEPDFSMWIKHLIDANGEKYWR